MEKTYQVVGMKCEGCAKTVQEKLTQVTGVDKVLVNLAAKTVTVTGDASEPALTAALSDTKFQLSVV
jgi:copper chaperone